MARLGNVTVLRVGVLIALSAVLMGGCTATDGTDEDADGEADEVEEEQVASVEQALICGPVRYTYAGGACRDEYWHLMRINAQCNFPRSCRRVLDSQGACSRAGGGYGFRRYKYQCCPCGFS